MAQATFLALYLLGTVSLIIASFGIPARSRFLPVVVLIVLLVCLLLKAAAVLYPKVGKLINATGGLGLFQYEQDMEIVADQERIPSSDRQDWKSVLWWLAGAVSVYLVGFLITIPLFLFATLRLYGKRRIWAAAVFSIVVTVLIYYAFRVLMHAAIFPGIIFS